MAFLFTLLGAALAGIHLDLCAFRQCWLYPCPLQKLSQLATHTQFVNKHQSLAAALIRSMKQTWFCGVVLSWCALLSAPYQSTQSARLILINTALCVSAKVHPKTQTFSLGSSLLLLEAEACRRFLALWCLCFCAANHV